MDECSGTGPHSFASKYFIEIEVKVMSWMNEVGLVLTALPVIKYVLNIEVKVMSWMNAVGLVLTALPVSTCMS